MCKKKILSLSAAVAVLSTGALAFETNYLGHAMKFGPDATGKYIKRDKNINTNDINSIVRKGPGELGDALIFPAFFGGLTKKEREAIERGELKKSNWSSEFSIVNTSDKAVVAKVVLYGKIASQELRDFNIYLSAHDVFRATLKNGRLISTDSSTVAQGLPSKKNLDFEPADDIKDDVVIDKNNNYKWDYDAIMASKDHELNISIDPTEDEYPNDNGDVGLGMFGDNEDDFEHEGYIVVYAMVQAESKNYHSKSSNEGLHKKLWQDYRHLIDTCRDTFINGNLNEWREGIEGGIYVRKYMYLPNIDMNATGRAKEVVATDYQSQKLCNTVFNSTAYKDRNNKGLEVKFKSPGAVLTGSILVSQNGDDGLGTRDMLIKAFAIDNYTDDNKSQALLWTEGEFANIGDRCLYSDYTKSELEKILAKEEDDIKDGIAKYNIGCVEKDSEQFWLNKTYYEYTNTNPDLSRLVVNQPYKRILVQFGDKYENAGGTKSHTESNAYAWHERHKIDSYNRRRYGTFDLEMDIYDDDEHSFRPTVNEFIVSPATAGTARGIPYEVSNISIFATMTDEDKAKFEGEFDKGYAVIEYKKNITKLPGIVTQMSAHVHTEKNNEAEVNWIYPYSEYENNQ
jgi:hypothetical protein